MGSSFEQGFGAEAGLAARRPSVPQEERAKGGVFLTPHYRNAFIPGEKTRRTYSVSGWGL